MTATNPPHPPLPPFTRETAAQKVRLAEDAWNTRDPQRVALAYAVDTVWRNRAEFPVGRAQVQGFLERKWAQGHSASCSEPPIDNALQLPQGRRPVDAARTHHSDRHNGLYPALRHPIARIGARDRRTPPAARKTSIDPSRRLTGTAARGTICTSYRPSLDGHDRPVSRGSPASVINVFLVHWAALPRPMGSAVALWSQRNQPRCG
jgi:Protein of unknown function (DUF1348)